ncbi:MAG: alanine/glycine:cation symporter family protein [Mangrovibacterium sp.]
MSKLNEILSLIDSCIGGSNWFVYLLLGTGLFFTIYLKFPQFRYLKHALRIVRGEFDRKGDQGDTTHFESLTTALSGTVGTGNIAGVALAIHLGGPAALFWMLVTALIGMTTKFVEVTLSHKYREITADGTVAGGPMYYLKNRLGIRWMAVLFAVATIFSSFGTGNLPQINSISNAVFSTFGINKVLTGGVLALLLGGVIIGGIKRIARVTSRLVPLMTLIYFFGALVVVAFNYQNIVPAFLSVFRDVFKGTAAAGGFLGAGFSFAFNRGVNRGLFSNEAGQGSAPIAHAAAKAHEPVSEGLVALLEPFIDTVIICMLTGLVILSSGVWKDKIENRFQRTDLQVLSATYSDTDPQDQKKLFSFITGKENLPLFDGELSVKNGAIQNTVTILHARSVAESVRVLSGNSLYSGKIRVIGGKLAGDENLVLLGKSLIHSAPLTTEAFSRSWFGPFGKYIVAAGLLLFAFSTAISWSYYGDRAVTFLFGKKGVICYHIIYVAGFFLASFTDTTLIWIFSGITVALMTIPNLVGILLLRREMKAEVKSFWEEYAGKFSNETSPVE